MAKTQNAEKWGRATAKERYDGSGMKKMQSGGRMPTDPESEQLDDRSGPEYSKGSKASLMETMRYHKLVAEKSAPDSNVGQGPTRQTAAFENRKNRK